MNRTIIALAAGLWALGVVARAQVTVAEQTPAAISMAVVDVQFLMQNSDAAKSIAAQIGKVRADFQRFVVAEQEDVQRLDQSITQQRATLSPEAYQQRVQELREKVAAYQRDVQDRQGRFESASRAAAQKIEGSIVQIVDEIKKERTYTLVLTRSAVVGTATIPDITQEVLTRLNQRLPSVTVDLPK